MMSINTPLIASCTVCNLNQHLGWQAAVQIHTNDECAILINACDDMIITLESIVLVLMI